MISFKTYVLLVMMFHIITFVSGQICSPNPLLNIESKVITLGERSWRKFVNVSLLWINLGGRENEVAERAVRTYNLREDEIPDIPVNVGYHRECYSVYTNICNIEQACKREDKKIQTIRGLYQLYSDIGLLYANRPYFDM